MFGLSGIPARVAEVALIIGLLFGSGTYVYNMGVTHQQEKELIAQAKRDKVEQKRYDDVVEKYTIKQEGRVKNAQVITKYVDKIITRDVYRNECIDDDGVRAINAAITGKDISVP